MKSFTRGLLILLVLTAPMALAVTSASANTELVPAARLVVPYWDITGFRDTFIDLVNVSRSVDLLLSKGQAVHLEFYDKTCTRIDRTIELSRGDIDHIDLKTKPNLIGHPNLPNGVGWADFDVRAADAQTGAPSLQYNVLLGTVIVSDTGADYALAYPAASSLGSARTGVGGVIVTRDIATGDALVWTGRYEPFPTRVFVPQFFAEGLVVGLGTFTGTIALAGPADGNWSGPPFIGEAPGQELPFILYDGEALFFDGCEQKFSQGLEAHYLFGTLTTLFGATITNRSNWALANCNTGTNPGVDENSKQPVGWIDLPNAAETDLFDGTDFRRRGLVGVFFETLIGSQHEGDVSRMWGDPSSITDQVNCKTSNGAATPCRYSFVDIVSHTDLK